LNDVNAFDPYHMEAYGISAVNYNRDIEMFPIIKTIFAKITGMDGIFKSPTDMSVNMAGYCITDDETVREAAKQEIVRRYFKTWCHFKEGRLGFGSVEKIDLIMKQLGITPEYGSVVNPALEKSVNSKYPAMALKLNDGSIITGRTTNILTAASSLILNCVKRLAGIPDEVHLIAPAVLEPMLFLKVNILCDENPLLSLDEVLNALSICAATDDTAKKCLFQLKGLNGCEAHSSHMLPKADETALRKLGVNVTCTPEFPSSNLFYD